ncbi:plasmid replication, integration and excision activator [Aquipuribacter sp. MA13-6]|uniref:plasmid replication, integration and excision activator n=1 Tax=unclassified Aquipuribacter TaxID=2635084 RepID=UPI003EEEC1FF
MAMPSGIPIDHGTAFPNGAFVIGEVTPVEDYDAVKAARESGRPGDVQSRDKNTGKRMWAVRVVDADDLVRKGQAEVTVKVIADVQPVPPEQAPGVPFRPVYFEGLTATAWVDTNRARPRLAWSFKATSMRAPARSETPTPGQRPSTTPSTGTGGDKAA